MAQVVISRNLTPYLEMIYPNASASSYVIAKFFGGFPNFSPAVGIFFVVEPLKTVKNQMKTVKTVKTH